MQAANFIQTGWRMVSGRRGRGGSAGGRVGWGGGSAHQPPGQKNGPAR